ncbi:opine metallophore biosynthesis dehydrogenase [Metabacillus sp. FJAT-52054]|uniref:Opine metallophore biosynthesis dehydrogenase n=1 Tax=Metabacillus sediminis TaxID=3117746 RepID=A0ABZ2NE16_9BACI
MNELRVHSKFGRILIAGAGPAAVQTAVVLNSQWGNPIGMANREGSRSMAFTAELMENNYTIQAMAELERLKDFAGSAVLEAFYEGYPYIEGQWETLILCTPSDTYLSILKNMKPAALIWIKTIVLISPNAGSNLLVRGYLKKVNLNAEVISLSSYYAATKLKEKDMLTIALTKAAKKKIYAGSSMQNSPSLLAIQNLLEEIKVTCVLVKDPLEAESRSITTFVHPPFFMNDFSLNEILTVNASHKSLYKLFPEGPITKDTIQIMVKLWKELNGLFTRFNIEPVNLLQFLNDDNYPVLPESLSREDIEGFLSSEQTKQEYHLYVRYASLLNDPHSEPDRNGRYFEFSKVPYPKVSKEPDGRWRFPRIPFEDYRNLKRLTGLARYAKTDMPAAKELIQLFEKRVEEFCDYHQVDKHLIIPRETSIAEEILMIVSEWEGRQNE